MPTILAQYYYNLVHLQIVQEAEFSTFQILGYFM